MSKTHLTFAALALLMTHAVPALATTTLKVGTLVPQNSPWGKDFKQWAKEVSDDTGGEVKLEFQWNGQGGDEALLVQKIRAGQIDGAAVSPLGLGATGVNDALLFSLPGLFSSWAKLDVARDACQDDLAKEFEQKGFHVVGWSDVGALREMSVGVEIHHPTDLRGKGMFFYAGDPITPRVYSVIGGITAKRLDVMEVLPALTAGAVNVVMAPPLGAEQLQWATRFDHISTQTLSFAIGAVIMSASRLKSLPAPLRQAVLARGAETTARLQTKIRNLDDEAFSRMKKRMTAYDPSAAEVAQWRPIFTTVARQLRGTTFTPALFDKVVSLGDGATP